MTFSEGYMSEQNLSINEFGKGDDIAGQAFRELWQARERGNPVRLAKSFLANAPDSYVDFVIEEVESKAATLKNWPSSAVLELGINGDRGAYCESDTRSVTLTFKVSISDEQKIFRTTCSMESFRKEFRANLVRISKLLSVI